MRLVIQRVSSASVTVDNALVSAIGNGLLVLLGVEASDTTDDIKYLAPKLCALRIFGDENGKMNLDLNQTGSELLIISQFTLFASTKKGNRPSFINAAEPQTANRLYEAFVAECSMLSRNPVKTGIFGADMKVQLVNDGPVTILMDSKLKE